MEPVWYYARNGKQSGPVTENDLRDMVKRGELRGSDLVWKKGSPEWVELRTVPGMNEPEPIPELPRSRKGRDERPEPRREERSRDRDRPRDEPDDIPERDRDRGRRRRDEWDDDGDDRRPSGPPIDFVGTVTRHLFRVFTWNLQKMEPTAHEKQTLTRSGITDETTQKYACWRRSVLWVTMGPAYFFALLAMIAYFKLFGALSVFGILAYLLLIVANFALPTGALLAAMSFERLGRSGFWLVFGIVISFATPILVSLIPGLWLIKDNPGEDAAKALSLYLNLIPSVLALLPGVSRACLRVKSVLPASVVAGWGYVLSAPLRILINLVIFIVIYQLLTLAFSATPLLLLGGLCWLATPLIYLTRTKLLTSPMSREDLGSLMPLTMIANIAGAVGLFFILIFLFVGEVRGGRGTIMGFGSDSGMTPFNLDLHRTWIEYVSRSLLMSVLFADLLIRMNLSIWKQDKTMADTDLAKEYNHAMENLSNLVSKGDPLLERRRRPAPDDDEDHRQRTLAVEDDDDFAPRRPRSSPRKSAPEPEPEPLVELPPEEPYKPEPPRPF